MKRYGRTMMLALCLGFVLLPASRADAQIPILDIIKAGVKKVIKAVDLKIQRLQNKTIWLQNAQQVLENTLSKTKLDEIADWTQRQREQYQVYFDELKTVKSVIVYYQRVRDVAQKQIRIVNEYQRAWQLVRQDGHFTASEVEYIGKVYAGILRESAKNVEQIHMVVQSFSLQMSDAERLALINAAADRVDENYNDLQRFNSQNVLLSLQRARSFQEINSVRRLYGL